MLRHAFRPGRSVGLIVGIAASLSLVACGGGSTCDRAAEHVATCLGESPAPPAAACSDAEAQTVLSQSCDELRGGLSRSAQGLGDLLCRFAAWLCPKPRDPQPKPSCGEPTSLDAASCLANELEGGSWSHDGRAILTRTALLAGDAEATREAFKLAQELEGNGWSHAARAFLAQAALLAPSPTALREAFTLAQELEGNFWSHEGRAILTIAALTAPSTTKLREAFALADALESGGWTHESRAILTQAALLAGSPDNTRKAFAQAEELNPSFWSHEGRAGQAFNAALSFADSSRARQPLVFHHDAR